MEHYDIAEEDNAIQLLAVHLPFWQDYRHFDPAYF
jgi:hypothetical protein